MVRSSSTCTASASHRDGTKPGVFLFCQQHAREWATGLTCVQTAHELVENYATDPYTKELLDNVEVFISPNSNPDGAHYSMYDSSVQRKTMPNYCPTTGNFGPRRPYHVGHGHEPQQRLVLPVRRLLRRVDLLHQRDLRRPVGVLRAGDPQRGLGPRHVPEHQVLQQHPLLRRLLHVGAGRLQERRLPHDVAGAEHRHREVLLRCGREHPQAHQGLARHGHPAGAHRPDRRRALQRGRQLGR